MHTISTNYDLKWQLDFAENYKFTADGVCVNTRRMKVVKRVVCGRSIGYCIKGKFYSLTALRKHLQKIGECKLPF